MNVSIRRQGINIKTIPVNSDRARVGSGGDCEIQLNDPFLAPVVAELVKRGMEWHIVDSGTSLEGITKEGVRVIDEPIVPGEPYLVGAFEIVTDANAMRKPLTRVDAASSDYIPMTMVESHPSDIPRTTVQPLPSAKSVRPPAGIAGAPSGSQKIVFMPAAGSTSLPPAASSRLTDMQKRRILLVALVAIATAVMTIALLSRNRSGGGAPQPVAETVGTASAQPTPAAPAVNGDELAKKLEIEEAFAAWEAQLAANPAATSDLRRRVVDGAFELGRAYAAANDNTNATRYFEKVALYGTPDSEQVRYARARLQPR